MSESKDERAEDPGRFEPLDPVVDREIPRLVSAQLTSRENVPAKRFHARLTLGFGEGELDGVNARYIVHLRNCIVQLSGNGCMHDMSDAYEYEFPPSAISDDHQHHDSQTVDSKIAAGGALSGRASHSLASVDLWARGEASKANSRSESRTVKVKRRFMRISCRGDHWLVGDEEYGDPSNFAGRLKGTYFNEDPTRPLCAILVQDGVETAEIAVEIRAKFGHLDVEVLDGRGKPARKARDGDALDISDAMRARLRGLALAKVLQGRSARAGVPLPESEFLLARRTLRAHMPRPEGVGECTGPASPPRLRESRQKPPPATQCVPRKTREAKPNRKIRK